LTRTASSAATRYGETTHSEPRTAAVASGGCTMRNRIRTERTPATADATRTAPTSPRRTGGTPDRRTGRYHPDARDGPIIPATDSAPTDSHRRLRRQRSHCHPGEHRSGKRHGLPRPADQIGSPQHELLGGGEEAAERPLALRGEHERNGTGGGHLAPARGPLGERRRGRHGIGQLPRVYPNPGVGRRSFSGIVRTGPSRTAGGLDPCPGRLEVLQPDSLLGDHRYRSQARPPSRLAARPTVRPHGRQPDQTVGEIIGRGRASHTPMIARPTSQSRGFFFANGRTLWQAGVPAPVARHQARIVPPPPGCVAPSNHSYCGPLKRSDRGADPATDPTHSGCRGSLTGRGGLRRRYSRRTGG
jgi:hypothetical protein